MFPSLPLCLARLLCPFPPLFCSTLSVPDQTIYTKPRRALGGCRVLGLGRGVATACASSGARGRMHELSKRSKRRVLRYAELVSLRPAQGRRRLDQAPPPDPRAGLERESSSAVLARSARVPGACLLVPPSRVVKSTRPRNSCALGDCHALDTCRPALTCSPSALLGNHPRALRHLPSREKNSHQPTLVEPHQAVLSLRKASRQPPSPRCSSLRRRHNSARLSLSPNRNRVTEQPTLFHAIPPFHTSRPSTPRPGTTLGDPSRRSERPKRPLSGGRGRARRPGSRSGTL